MRGGAMPRGLPALSSVNNSQVVPFLSAILVLLSLLTSENITSNPVSLLRVVASGFVLGASLRCVAKRTIEWLIHQSEKLRSSR